MTKITERFLSDNFWYCLIVYLKNKGEPYVTGTHEIGISYRPSSKFMKKELPEQQKDNSRYRWFKIDKWDHPVDPPTHEQLLELQVEDVMEFKLEDQVMMYSRTDRYMARTIQFLAEYLKTGERLPADWQEQDQFNEYVREMLGIDREIERVKKEWEDLQEEVSTISEPTPETSATPTPFTEEQVTAAQAAVEDQIDKVDDLVEKGKEKMTPEEEEAFVAEVDEIMKPATYKIKIGGK
jgi:gas vesicle protein